MSDYDGWDKIFDKSKASKVPDRFPGDAINPSLQLEDVFEEVTDEINQTGQSTIGRLPERVAADDGQQYEIQSPERIKMLPTETACREQRHQHSIPSSKFKNPMTQSFNAMNSQKPEVEIAEGLKSLTNGRKSKEIEESIERHEINIADINLDPIELNSDDALLQELKPEVFELEKKKGLQLGKVEIYDTKDTELVLDTDIKGKQITLEEAKNLRFLLFGSLTTSFTEQWTKQNIRLNRSHSYPLFYHKGPTEGVISCIQAFVLKHVLFDGNSNGSNSSSNQPGSYHRKCLVSALVDILWQAGLRRKAVVCLPSSKQDAFYSIDLKLDGLIEKLFFYEFDKEEALQKFLEANFRFFEKDGEPGCVLFIYSLIMSRTIESVNEEIEGPYNCLLGQDNCSQALLNLFLVGEATPNVFNNTKEVKNENGKVEIHNGLSKRSEIGFLSSEEVENPKTFVVGSMLKTPIFPIWIVSLRDRICVLFCRKRQLLSDWKLERRFDLYYRGRLSRHYNVPAEDVRLSIDTVRPFDPEETEYEFNSDLEDTIRTKWQDCVIEWNGFNRF